MPVFRQVEPASSPLISADNFGVSDETFYILTEKCANFGESVLCGL